MEFEDVSAPAWLKIRRTIEESKAVFELLGPNVRSSIYTQNWIAFEVGLTCALGKKVWELVRGLAVGAKLNSQKAQRRTS